MMMKTVVCGDTKIWCCESCGWTNIGRPHETKCHNCGEEERRDRPENYSVGPAVVAG
ncbi:MAG: hypothetical protein ABFD12_14480 [Syntrophorhabdus sp.]